MAQAEVAIVVLFTPQNINLHDNTLDHVTARIILCVICRGSLGVCEGERERGRERGLYNSQGLI